MNMMGKVYDMNGGGGGGGEGHCCPLTYALWPQWEGQVGWRREVGRRGR